MLGKSTIEQYDAQHAVITLGSIVDADGELASGGTYADFSVINRANAAQIVGSISGNIMTVSSVIGVISATNAVFLGGTIDTEVTINAFGSGGTTGSGGVGTYQISSSSYNVPAGTTMLIIDKRSTGIIFGSQSNSRFHRISVSGVSSTKPWIGAKFISPKGFFSNVAEGCRFVGGALTMLQYTLGGTGSVWINTYIGGGGKPGASGGPGHYCVGPVLDINAGGNQGAWIQTNIEWVSSQIIMRYQNTVGQVFESLHIEGCQLSGSSPTVFELNSSNSATKTIFNSVRLEDVDIRSTAAGGKITGPSTVSLIKNSNSGGAEFNGFNWFMNEAIGTYGTCDVDVTLHRVLPITGSLEQIVIRQFTTSWTNTTFFLTSGFEIDSTIPRDPYGIVTAFQEYVYNRGRSRTRGAAIWAPANVDFTHWGVHTNARIAINWPITADRKIIVKNKIAKDFLLSTSDREIGDIVQIIRTSGATGAFNILVRNYDDLGTSVHVFPPGAGEVFVCWNGTAVTKT